MNGIVLSKEEVLALMADADAGLSLEIDLSNQIIKRGSGNSNTIPFTVDPFRKHCLLNGLDDIGLTLQKVEQINTFERTRSVQYPWLDYASQVPPVGTSKVLSN